MARWPCWCARSMLGLDGGEALSEQVAEVDLVGLEHASNGRRLGGADASLVGSVHSLESFDILGIHARFEGVVGREVSEVGVGHLGC